MFHICLMANKSGKQVSMLQVYVDTGLINTPGVGARLLQMCESIGVCCSARDQLMNNTVTWQLVYESDIPESCRVEEMDEVLSIIPVNQFVAMVNSQVKVRGEKEDHVKKGLCSNKAEGEKLSLTILLSSLI